MLLKVATALAALLALSAYRNGRVAWNHIFTVPDLPDAYYVGGNWTTHCSLIKDLSSNDINFCEDITFWDHHDANGVLSDRFVLIGCDPNRKAWNTVMGPLRDPNPRGHLFLYAPTTSAVQRLTLEGYPAGHDFHPLGMDIYPSYDGSPSNLFIVNHARAQTTIEQFILDPAHPTEARFVRTLRSPHFVSPNSIALTSPTSFFVSNDHLLTRRLPNPIGHVVPLVETIAGLPLSWVAHVSVHAPEPGSTDGADDYALAHTFAALGIAFANGVALSPSRAELAIASTTLGLVHLYALDADAGAGAGAPSLSFSHSVPVPFFPDNLAYDDDGALIVAGHPHFTSLVGVAANETGAISPSWAISLTPTPVAGGNGDTDTDARAPLSASKLIPRLTTHEVETLFQSDGSVFGSLTTMLRDARTGTIYASGLYEEGVLVCQP